MNTYSILIILGIVAIIVEIIIGAATGFELLVLGIVFVIGGGIGMLTGSIHVAIGTIIVLILGYIVFGRSRIKDALHITTTKTNADSIVGNQAIVEVGITPEKAGQIKIDGEIWRAVADVELKKGTTVTIESISGVTVTVK